MAKKNRSDGVMDPNFDFKLSSACTEKGTTVRFGAAFHPVDEIDGIMNRERCSQILIRRASEKLHFPA